MMLLPQRGAVESAADNLLEKMSQLSVRGDILYEAGRGSQLRLRNGKPEKDSSGLSFRIGVRVIGPEGRQGVADAGALSPAVLDRTLDSAVAAMKNADPEDGVSLFQGELASQEGLELEDERIRNIAPEERMERCREMTETALAADSRVRSVRSAAWSDGDGESLYLSTEGQKVWSADTFVSCGVSVVMETGESMEMGGFGGEARNLDALDCRSVAKRAVDRTALFLGGRSVPTGRYRLVLDPEVTASFVEMLGELFLYSNIWKKRSLFEGKTGELVAGKSVSIVDDGRLPGKFGTAPFDGEGTPTGRTVLMENGRVCGFLNNLKYATLGGMEPTGNAVRSPGSLPDVGPSNLFILPGERAPKDLMLSSEGGLYVVDLLGFHTVDPVSGDFSLGVKGATLHGGVADSSVAGVAISGNLLEFLPRIAEVANDLEFFGDTGGCTVVVDDVVVAGS